MYFHRHRSSVMVEHRCCHTANIVRHDVPNFQSQTLSMLVASENKTARASELLGNVARHDAYRRESFAVGVVHRGNRSTIAT